MKLTEAQSKWLSYLMPPGEMLKRFLRTAVGRKFVGDKTFEKRFYHFIAGGKGVSDNVAAAIWLMNESGSKASDDASSV